MKKIAIFSISLFCIFALTSISFAREKKSAADSQTHVIRGKIVSIDTAIEITPQMASSLKQDEDVRVRIKNGTNTAEAIREVKAKKSSHKADK